jgi:hypothetical protein
MYLSGSFDIRITCNFGAGLRKKPVFPVTENTGYTARKAVIGNRPRKEVCSARRIANGSGIMGKKINCLNFCKIFNGNFVKQMGLSNIRLRKN